MKKTIYLFMIALVAGVFTSCKDQDDIYKQWVVPGGSVYPEKANGMTYVQGHQRLLLKWAAPKDPSVAKAIITWDNGDQTAEINYDDYAGKDSIEFEVNNLKEQSYTFYVNNYDVEGHKSVSSQVTATPYGDVWLSTHAERTINSAEVTSGTDATVSIGFGTNEMIATKFRYKTNDGEWVETEPVPSNQSSVVFPNAKVNCRYEYSSGYCPTAGLDTIWNEWKKSPTPIAGRLSSEGWEVTATGYNAANPPSKILDGVITSGGFDGAWLWSNGGKYPVVVQIDMKKSSYVITRLRVVNYQGSMAYRHLYNVAYFFGDEPFNLDPGSSYAAVNVTPWPISTEPTFAKAKYWRTTTFWNGDAAHTENANNTQCRYIAMTMHNSRVGSRIGCQEIEVYGYDADAE